MTMNDKTKKIYIYKIRQVNHKKKIYIYFSLINYEWHKDII